MFGAFRACFEVAIPGLKSLSINLSRIMGIQINAVSAPGGPLVNARTNLLNRKINHLIHK